MKIIKIDCDCIGEIKLNKDEFVNVCLTNKKVTEPNYPKGSQHSSALSLDHVEKKKGRKNVFSVILGEDNKRS